MSMFKIALVSWGISADGNVLTKDACKQMATAAIGKIVQSPVPTPTARWRIVKTELVESEYIAGAGQVIAECQPVPEDTPITDEEQERFNSTWWSIGAKL